MRLLCPVDVSAFILHLSTLPWLPGGSDPRAGQYAMLSWPLPLPGVEPFIAAILGQHFPGRRRGVAFLSRLIPGQRIDPHVDGHDHCDTRVHVPLATNPLAVFITGGVEHHLEVGWAYVIDPSREHSVVNGGRTDRVHLIFNAVR